MRSDTWMWRGILLTVVVLLFSGIFLLWRDGIWAQLSTQVQQAVSPDPVLLDAEITDELSGVVSVRQTLLSRMLTKRLRDDGVEVAFPLSFRWCLDVSRSGAEEHIDCQERVLLSEDVSPQNWSSLYVIPDGYEEFALVSRVFLPSFQEQSYTHSSREQNLTWTPKVSIKEVTGNLLDDAATIVQPDVLIAVGRTKNVVFTLDDQVLSSQLMVDPPPRNQFLDPEEQELAFFTWLIGIPGKEVNHDESSFCVVASGLQQSCYTFTSIATRSSGSPAVCGDNLLEAPEQCDDGNTASGDGCNAFCELEDSDFRSTVSPKILIDRLDDGSRLVFASLQSDGLSVDDYRIELVEDGDSRMLDVQFLDDVLFVQFVTFTNSTFELRFLKRSAEGLFLMYQSLIESDTTGSIIPTSLSMAAPYTEGSTGLENAHLESVQFEWIGSDQSIVNKSTGTVLDVGEQPGELRTRLVIQSLSDSNLDVDVAFVGDNIRFKQQVLAGERELVDLNANDFPYGTHELKIAAHFADGRQIADVSIPFEYVPNTFLRSLGSQLPSRMLFLLGSLCVILIGALWYRSR